MSSLLQARKQQGTERGGVWRGGATKLRIHNSFIWPYLHIFSALRRRKKRAEIGIWLAFLANILAYAAPLPCFTSPLPQQRSTLPWLQSYSPTVLVVVARALPRHSSNSSHVIVENETNFCNLIAFRVDAEQGEREGWRGREEERVPSNNLPMYSPVACESLPRPGLPPCTDEVAPA